MSIFVQLGTPCHDRAVSPHPHPQKQFPQFTWTSNPAMVGKLILAYVIWWLMHARRGLIHLVVLDFGYGGYFLG